MGVGQAALLEFIHVNSPLFEQSVLDLCWLGWHWRCPNHDRMHVEIDRLYWFVMGALNLTDAEQSHLIRCQYCVDWLDASVEEKVSLLTNRIRWVSSLQAPPQEHT